MTVATRREFVVALASELPPTFRHKDALTHMSERQFRNLVDAGLIVRVARGIYQRADVGDAESSDIDLVEIAVRVPRATLALATALAKHGLIDEIPQTVEIALPRGVWVPSSIGVPVTWHHFDQATFDVGRDEVDVGAGVSIGVYSGPRSIIDAFRLRHLEGDEMALEALKSWLRSGGQPSELIDMARAFPRVQSVIARTLSVLL